MPDVRPQRLALLLRRASNDSALESLLRRLGLPRDYLPLPRAALARVGLRPSVTRRVRSGGSIAPVYLAELAVESGPEVIQQVARALAGLAEGPFLFVLWPPRARTIVFGCRSADGVLRFAPVGRLHARPAEQLLLEELAAAPAGELARLLHWARVLDRGTVGIRFFREIRAHRDALARAWTGLPATAVADREQLALLLLCRLLFLCFLQERGHLLGDPEYLPRLLRESRSGRPGQLYDAVVRVLFFGVFNTRPEQRSEAAAAFGPLPYLNGGLFEPHGLERRHPALGLPDDVLRRCFSDLLDRYRFSSADAADAEASGAIRSGIDPEVLGRVFEALMAAPRRGDTGSFYTPAEAVDQLVTRALACVLASPGELSRAVAERLIAGGVADLPRAARTAARARLGSLRVLDPACGSGAFLLGALSRLARVRAGLEPDADPIAIRRELVGHTLHGVDLLDDAALLCALRLWLALAPQPGETVSPLPNLDRRIRQGDALLDPLDLLAAGATAGPDRGAVLEPDVRRRLRELEQLGNAYLGAGPEERPALRTRLHDLERELARGWLEALRTRLAHSLREADANAAARDLWGDPGTRSVDALRLAERLTQRLAEIDALLRALSDAGALPFFSFAVHFAAAGRGFDLVLGNPPWVRAHRWPAALAGAVRTRFRVCRDGGWPGVRRLLATGGGPGGQVDLALLFLERGVELLAERGVLAMLLPAKLLRSVSAGGARALLLERVALVELDDHSLDQHSVFRADAFTMQLVAQRAPAGEPVRITMRNRGRQPLEFAIPATELPLLPDDHHSPWLIAPQPVLAVLRLMQRRGEAVGSIRSLALRRGIITGANDVLVVPSAEHKLGGLSRVRAQGWFRARRTGDGSSAGAFAGWIETESLRPLVRGADVKAWHWSAPQRLIWIPANDRPGAVTPGRTARFLARHAGALARRSGAGVSARDGRVLRVGDGQLGHRVAWQDIADDLHAAALPATVRADDGRQVPLVALNTVYFVCAPAERTAHVLAALLNSLPLRVFARAAAERAKDARFRFFAWTIAALPLPSGWLEDPLACELETISQAAHQERGIDEECQRRLDLVVAHAFGLDDAQLDSLQSFDTWLKR